MVGIGLVGAARHIREIYWLYFTLPYLFFSNEATGQTDQPIFTHDISNNVVCSKEVPLGGRNSNAHNLGAFNPIKPPKIDCPMGFSMQIENHE